MYRLSFLNMYIKYPVYFYFFSYIDEKKIHRRKNKLHMWKSRMHQYAENACTVIEYYLYSFISLFCIYAFYLSLRNKEGIYQYWRNLQ